jgi:NADH dehydrogenase
MRSDNTILVTGAGGFIGKDIVRCLLENKFRVRAMIRGPANFPFIRNPNLEVAYGDMCDLESLRIATRGVSAVIHLAAAKSDEIYSYAVNVKGTENLIEACLASGCERIINMSTQSVKIKIKGKYASTKKEAEDVLHGSGLQVTSLRPSIVYGEEQLGVFGTVLKYILSLPFVPVLGDGKWITAPVYIQDVSEAVIACIRNNITVGRIYDIGGPDLMNFDDFIDKICFELDLRRAKVHIPFRMSLTIARLAAKIMKAPPLTVSNVLGSNQDTDIDIEPAKRDFGFSPRGIDSGLKKVVASIKRQKDPVAITFKKSTSYDEELKAESIIMGRYLIGDDPPEDLIERYLRANKILFDKSRGEVPGELKILHSHPSLLPFMDAAAGVISRDSLIRKKLLLMTAILETSPLHADYFLHKADSLPVFVKNIVLNGVKAVIKLIIGVPLLLLVRFRYG